ncbi:hypothetical protein [Sulfurirhabdus autotrophica]|nr:hypothetical protein [Sulfurirhabdus autotrophica]
MNTFTETLNGTLYGVMSWVQWETLQATMLKNRKDGWYVYYVGEKIPVHKQSNEGFAHILGEINQLLRRDHDESYLGIIYTDHFDAPTLIEIYDPNNLGAYCGSSGKVIPPGWIISKMPPEVVIAPQIIPQGRKRWWKNLLPHPGSTTHSPT